MKISRQTQKFSIQEFNFDRSVCMAAICYSDPISAVQINEQLFAYKRTYTKLQFDNTKTDGLVFIYTDRRTDGWLDRRVNGHC